MEKKEKIETVETVQTVQTVEKRTVTADKKVKSLTFAVMVLGVLIMLAQWIVGLNIISIIGALYMCIVSALIAIGVIFQKKLHIWYLVGYVAVSFGVATYFIFNGADAGWGAITTGHTGFSSAVSQLWQGTGNFGTRLVGNVIICAPAFLLLLSLYLVVLKLTKGGAKIKNVITGTISVALVGMSVMFVFTMNLRSNPRAFDMSKGEKEYLDNVNKTANSKSPNVLVILLDDLGYGDTSFNGCKAYSTPTIDSIAKDGLNFENFYASYSVCSPSRFALMTGRYPYRGYADNVMYPTVNTFAPLATTRVFNSIELGANVDGMIGDEVTVAETFKKSGYATGCFGKWHLGDYGQYLPTNQGFDYFYGSHHVNDMVPFYHASEKDGEYEIAVGTDDLNQSEATKRIHDVTYDWIADKADNSEPFFAYYASPWPHAPIYAGDDFRGTSGAGIYADCVTEFDSYLGQLFDMMKAKGIYDNTIISFTSDNGPALQGSTNEMRGGKYTPYDGGQKVPYYMRWGNNVNMRGGRTISAPATLADLYPTLVDLCGINGQVGGNLKTSYLPSDVDREIDGVSMMPLINDTTNSVFIHNQAHPILHMRRESIKAVQYSLTKDEVIASVKGYKSVAGGFVADEEAYMKTNIMQSPNTYLTWKYFGKMTNDNPAFPDKVRKNWLMCLTDDSSESYQRADTFPSIASDFKNTAKEWTKKFADNRRGTLNSYYGKK